MKDAFQLPVGLRRWRTDAVQTPQQQDGYELSLLENCDNAYRFTLTASVDKILAIFSGFTRFFPDEAFFILEFYPEELLTTRPSSTSERQPPEVYYSPYLPTFELLQTLTPYLERMIHDGFVGFGLANNRLGLELFYSEEKVMTFFTDNHLRLSNFLSQQRIPYSEKLILPADFGHDHLSLLGFPRKLLPPNLAALSDKELDSAHFCQELIDDLDMYPVEEGLSFFLTRKEQEQITELVEQKLAHNEFSDIEFGSLLLDWSDFVTECENGFEGNLWEYRQGLMIRDTVQMVIEVAPQPLADKITSIVAEPDGQFLNILTDRRKRLDPPAEPQLHQERFWYQGMVGKQGIDLRRDLIRQGWFKH